MRFIKITKLKEKLWCDLTQPGPCRAYHKGMDENVLGTMSTDTEQIALNQCDV